MNGPFGRNYILIASMSNLDIYQQFVDTEALRTKMELPPPVTAVLDYSEYAVRMAFNLSEKHNYLLKKSRKKEMPKEFVASLQTLNREEKIHYYCMVVGYMQNFLKGDFEPPKCCYSGFINATGYSRSFNLKIWKQKKLRLDMNKHLMFAEREQKIKSYDMRNYLMRKSNKTDIFCFVLEAINDKPPEKSMTVHIGFYKENIYKEFVSALKNSIKIRQWEYYLEIFQGYQSSKVLIKSMSAKTLTATDLFSKTVSSQQKQERAATEAFKSGEDKMSTSDIVESTRRKQIEHPHQLKMKKIESSEDEVKGNFSDFLTKSTPQKPQGQSEKIKQKQKLQHQIQDYLSRRQLAKTYVDLLIEGQVFEEPDVFEDMIEEEEDQLIIKNKKCLDLFHKLYPQYEMEQLTSFENFQMKHQTSYFKIYQSTEVQKRFKMLMVFSKGKYSKEQIVSMISKPETSHIYNDNIQSSQLKTFIPSQNSAMMYQVNKPYNRLYRARDFVFIRHVFNIGSNIYMVDKSVENANYPPFITIVRGQIRNVYGIVQKAETIDLIADFQIENGGLLNLVQETNLTLKYLKGYLKLFEAQISRQSYKFFRLDWDISQNKANQIQDEIRVRRKTINQLEKEIIHDQQQKQFQEATNQLNFSKKKPQEKEKIIKSDSNITPQKNIQTIRSVQSHQSNDSPTYNHKITELEAERSLSSSPESVTIDSPKKLQAKRFNRSSMEEVGQITAQQAQRPLFHLQRVRQFNLEGYMLVDQSYTKTKYMIEPLKETEVVLVDDKQGHPVWKNQWVHDDEEGGIIFINKKKLEDQKGVMKFILSKMAKNLVSGESITNISLPADIFMPQSNLQRFLYSMCYGPLLLEGLLGQNILKRLLRTAIFGLSNSILFYVTIEKPFNPIIGETFQCWINGCPAYGEQISHHPPVGALFLKGRGYQVTTQLQSKASMGMNKGTISNEGTYRVKFADDVEICFTTPQGEINGLTSGDRKFNICGKSYYWVTNTNILLEIIFDPYKKGFFSIGKQEKPSDYFQGTIWEVSPEFMVKFLKGKRKQIEAKDKVKKYGDINGTWNKNICFNGQEIWNFNRQYPVVLEYQANPLPSDSNWREDIEYRRRNLITRAQTQKERLELNQRKDRKMREKRGKK